MFALSLIISEELHRCMAAIDIPHLAIEIELAATGSGLVELDLGHLT